jgi:thiamine-phosphate pyrophosphorylase
VDVPIVAIGGITPENAGPVIDAGADAVAVISAITAATDPQAATQRLGRAVGNDDQ